MYFLQEVHRLHATLNPLLLGNSIARLLPVISMLPPLKSAVLIVMDSFLREMMRVVKPALVWKEISALVCIFAGQLQRGLGLPICT